MDSLSLESALGVPPTSTAPHDWSIIDTWFVKLKVDFYWSIALQTHVDGLHSLLARIWNELKNPTKQRVNNLFAQIQAARTRLSMTPRDLTALLVSSLPSSPNYLSFETLLLLASPVGLNSPPKSTFSNYG